jgi:hypothetical protein
MIDFIKKLFYPKVQKTVIVPNNELENIELPNDHWYDILETLPPFEVVLVACETYDCGWQVDAGWWHEKNKCWMTCGNKSEESHLDWTHWRKMVEPPQIPSRW